MRVRCDIPGKVHDKVKRPVDAAIMQSSTVDVRDDVWQTSWDVAWASTRTSNLNSVLRCLLDDELYRITK